MEQNEERLLQQRYLPQHTMADIVLETEPNGPFGLSWTKASARPPPRFGFPHSSRPVPTCWDVPKIVGTPAAAPPGQLWFRRGSLRITRL